MKNPEFYSVLIKHNSTDKSVMEHMIQELIDEFWSSTCRLYLKELSEDAHRPNAKCVIALWSDLHHTDKLERFAELGQLMRQKDFLAIYIYDLKDIDPNIDLDDKDAFLVKPNTDE